MAYPRDRELTNVPMRICRFKHFLHIPGHALHEKGLQRQIGDGTLVSSQERRALAVPLINRGFRSSIGLNRISFVRASEETSRTVSSIRWGAKGRVVSWPPRPDRPVECPGFGFDKYLY